MESKPNEKDEDKLKPIDVKDIKKPTEYDGKVDEFTAWYERLKDLLINRHPSWAKVVKVIEDKKDKRIINAIDEIFGDLDEKGERPGGRVHAAAPGIPENVHEEFPVQQGQQNQAGRGPRDPQGHHPEGQEL